VTEHYRVPVFFHKVDQRFQSPVRTVWLAVFLAFCLGLPSLGSSVALTAATSIATSGLYISYGIPIAIRLWEHKTFVKGPFHLGKFSLPIAAIAVAYIMFITIVFILPELTPVNSQTLNYTVVACGAIAIFSSAYWLISARKWFKGPRRFTDAAELAMSEPYHDLE